MFKELRYWKVITFGVAGLIFAICLSCLGLNQQGLKRTGDSNTNTELTIQVTASHSLVKLPPTPDLHPLNCEPTTKKVKLHANTISPHKAEMNFTWHVPVGRLVGKTSKVMWDLSGVEPGTYTATVEVTDRHKHTASGSTTVTVVTCPGERYDPPPCPGVSVSCPSKIESKDSLIFAATVVGGYTEKTPTYKWSLSAGKIISGKATSKITVDVSGLSHDSVTGTVSVGGFNRGCFTVASCTTEVVKTKLQ